MITMGLGTLAMLTWGLGNALRMAGMTQIITPIAKVEFRDKPSGAAFIEKPSTAAFVERRGREVAFKRG